MAEPFEITKSVPQEPSEGGAQALEQPLNRLQYIVFVGRQGEQKRVVEVLADEAAPTPSAGYAKWVHIPRPQRTALTILEGYEPMTLTVPVLFDAIRSGTMYRENVEFQIQKLEWMAGRGILFKKPYKPGVGKPPLVEVYSAKFEQRSTELIPKPFQTPNIKWYVDDLTFDEHPLRGTQGARRRQACVVRLIQYVQDATAAEEGQEKSSYTVKKSTKSLNTVKKLVAHYLVGPRSKLGEAVKETMALNKNNKAIGSHPEKHLKVGTKVKIPNQYL